MRTNLIVYSDSTKTIRLLALDFYEVIHHCIGNYTGVLTELRAVARGVLGGGG